LQPIPQGPVDRRQNRGETGQVVHGVAPGRRSAQEVTLFKSLGLAMEDLAAAALAWRSAQISGAGTTMDL